MSRKGALAGDLGTQPGCIRTQVGHIRAVSARNRTSAGRIRNVPGRRCAVTPSPGAVAWGIRLPLALIRIAKVAARVVQGNPDLDEITQRLTATFGANLANKTAGDARDAVLGRIARLASTLIGNAPPSAKKTPPPLGA